MRHSIYQMSLVLATSAQIDLDGEIDHFGDIHLNR